MSYLKFIIALLTCCSIIFSQSGVTSKTGTVAAIPATCIVGEWYWANNATPGANLYFCTSLNTWTASGGAAGVTSLAATSPFAVSDSTGAVTGSLLTNVDYGFTAAQSVTKAVGASLVDGLVLATSTPATSGNQKWSPGLRLTGNAYSGSASTPVDWMITNQPVQGTTLGNLTFSRQINGGGYTNMAAIQNTATVVVWQLAGNGYIYGTASSVGLGTLSGQITFQPNDTAQGLWDATNFSVGTGGGGKFNVANATGKLTQYNNIATVSNGVPSELATIDLTAQTAAKGSTALYTPTATGWFRFQYTAKVTTAASISSILGGTSGLTLSYQDGTDSVNVSMVCPEFDQNGANLSIGTGNTGNTTASMVQGSCQIYAKTGVAINYTFGYSSTNAAEMVYTLRGKLEAM